MRTDPSKSRALIHLQLRFRAFLFDKASASFFTSSPSSSSSISFSTLNPAYLQLHADDIYFTIDNDGVQGTTSSSKFGYIVLTTSVGIMDHEEARRKNVGGTRTCSSQACRGIIYSTKMQRRIRVGVGQGRGRTSASISKSESVKSAIKSVDTSALERSGSDDESMDDPPRTVSRQDTAGRPKSKRMKTGLAGSSLAKEDIKPQPVEGSFPLSDSECTGSNLSITVVGASGDLAKKKIFPALFAFYYEDWLPENFLVFGYARTKMTDEELRNMISKTLTCRINKRENCEEKMDQFLKRCFYHSGLYNSEDHFSDLDC